MLHFRWMALALGAGCTSAALARETLDIQGSYRVRYESLKHRVRARYSGSDQILVHRLLVNGLVRSSAWRADLEFQDARAWRADNGTPLSTGDVNAAALLQAYVGFRVRDSIGAGERLDVRLGRFTMDLGSRRLVARNRFRNTLNAFTGIDLDWQDDRRSIRIFYTLPVQRRPSAANALLANAVEADTESSTQRFCGLVAAQRISIRWRVEEYIFGLFEHDGTREVTRHRRLVTPGLRLRSSRAEGGWRYEFEAAAQFGHARAARSTTAPDLAVHAGFVHLETSHAIDAPWAPRVILQYDYVTGDHDPGDREYNRFDTLFGARRFDFGPTGIYGAFVRANINSLGIRLNVSPAARLHGFVGYRIAWLASRRDRELFGYEPDGSAGGFAGQQIEFRLRYRTARHIQIEMGGAWLARGGFMRNTAEYAPGGNPVYGYIQGTLTFGTRDAR